ncbi:hypothetical protein LOK49_LG03G03518 [Camellia lanceoleosa]|uniref:Uncharacterized protein n=1 Tax=Camellia lanceoleosa TaxID=1840588 RepID=A0ACC0I988_9ERIC|nr:hypothetical protein LOK49_LG03G03518 [Camellia lanceoleosa]
MYIYICFLDINDRHSLTNIKSSTYFFFYYFSLCFIHSLALFIANTSIAIHQHCSMVVYWCRSTNGRTLCSLDLDHYLPFSVFKLLFVP